MEVVSKLTKMAALKNVIRIDQTAAINAGKYATRIKNVKTFHVKHKSLLNVSVDTDKQLFFVDLKAALME